MLNNMPVNLFGLDAKGFKFISWDTYRIRECTPSIIVNSEMVRIGELIADGPQRGLEFASCRSRKLSRPGMRSNQRFGREATMNNRLAIFCWGATLAIAIGGGPAVGQTWTTEPVMSVPAPDSGPRKASTLPPPRSDALQPRYGDIAERWTPVASQQPGSPPGPAVEARTSASTGSSSRPNHAED